MTSTNYWNSFSFKNEKLLIYFLLYSLFFSYKTTAQNNLSTVSEQFYKTISFDEKIDFGNVDSAANWTITNSKGNSSNFLNGSEINNYQFKQPGIYEVSFQENAKHDGECDHAVFPKKFRVKVEPVKLSFDFSKVKFSQKLERGKNYSDLIISVPAEIISIDNSITQLPAPKMSVAGIGVLLNAEPVEKEIILTAKNQILKYKVSGTINNETYLMFDFYDFNNEVKTYNLPQKIK
ncbi:hypothetical protein ASE40_05490 [Flavobacterium sp. Root935]|uniref:hypothetical protein n=1 Tax=Flavobacterium sp. Root935 TaxID=1736610 RepID=UPI00070C91EC|nr:hypothetical protein [Flavobacterium sp. Root935]KRD61008.1 hypothetical protein ASE40_05490 [Flavobacterium sp. Root935]